MIYFALIAFFCVLAGAIAWAVVRIGGRADD